MTCKIDRQEFKTIQNTSGKHQDTDATGRNQAHQERTAVVRVPFFDVHRDKSNSTSFGCALSGQSGGLLGGRAAIATDERMKTSEITDSAESATDRVDDFTDFTPENRDCKIDNRQTVEAVLRILRILHLLREGVRGTPGCARTRPRTPARCITHPLTHSRKIRKIRKLPRAFLRFRSYTSAGPRCKTRKIAARVDGEVTG